MIKKLLCILLSVVFFNYSMPANAEQNSPQENMPLFHTPNDSDILQYIQDSVYASMEEELANDDYQIQEVCATYVSRELLEEMEYYSRENIYFGYTLSELDARFEGKRYFFTLGDDKQTAVKEFVAYDNSTEVQRIIKNFAIGAGVIVVCVTVSCLTGIPGAPKVIQIIHYIAVDAAKLSTKYAASGAFIGATSAAITEKIEGGDSDSIIDAALVSASEGFKWGAIVGSIKGGKKGFLEYKATEIPSWQDSEQKALEIYCDSDEDNYQVSFRDKEVVPGHPEGSTRPDIIRKIKDHWEGIEVKNYDCKNNKNQLLANLRDEVADRIVNMPENSTQRVVLDFRGRGYTEQFAETIKEFIQDGCSDIYPNLPVDIIW